MGKLFSISIGGPDAVTVYAASIHTQFGGDRYKHWGIANPQNLFSGGEIIAWSSTDPKGVEGQDYFDLVRFAEDPKAGAQWAADLRRGSGVLRTNGRRASLGLDSVLSTIDGLHPETVAPYYEVLHQIKQWLGTDEGKAWGAQPVEGSR